MAACGFTLPDSVLDNLSSSKAFQILQSHLSSDPANQPCASHPKPDLPTHTLLSTLHLLLQPISHLHQTCTSLAHAALCRPSPSELELAFQHSARSAFLWLTCFLDDRDTHSWLSTRGCPSCILERTLSCDSTVRMALAASLLAAHRPSSADLPDLSFFAHTLKDALDRDPFWGPGFHAELLAKARVLADGIQEMVAQAAELEILVSSPAQSPKANRVQLPPGCLVPTGEGGEGAMRVMVGPVARRQRMLREEEERHVMRLRRVEWMRLGDGRGECLRKRSLTWQL